MRLLNFLARDRVRVRAEGGKRLGGKGREGGFEDYQLVLTNTVFKITSHLLRTGKFQFARKSIA